MIRIACILVLLLSACGRSGSDLAKPIELPSAFSQSGSADLQQKWWLSFNDQGLAQLIDVALSDNFSIKQAHDRLRQAQAVARRSGSDRFPSLDANASVGRTRVDNNGTVNSTNSMSVGLSASYEIDLWGRVGARVRADELDAQAKQKDLHAAAISLSADVALTWYRLVAAHKRVTLLKQELETQSNIQSIIKEQFKFGKVRAADVYRQQQLLAGTRASVSKAQADVHQLKHQLMVLLGKLPKQKFALPAFTFAALPPLPQTGIPTQILDQRPDVRSAWLNVLAADQRVAVARADRYPRLSINASVSSDAEDIGDLFDNWIFRLVGNIVQPLFDGGRRRAEEERTKAVLSERVHVYAQTVLEAVRDVEDALIAEQQQQEFIKHLTEQVRVNKIVLERTQDLYRKGQSDYLRVLESLNSHVNLKQDQISAERDLLEQRIRLYRSLAGYWEFPKKMKEKEVLHD